MPEMTSIRPRSSPYQQLLSSNEYSLPPAFAPTLMMRPTPAAALSTASTSIENELLPLELFTTIAFHLHPYKIITKLRRLSRRYHQFLQQPDDFQFARQNLRTYFADSLEKLDLEPLRRLDWERLGKAYRAALISLANFTSSTLRMLNPQYSGLSETAPPSYENKYDEMALEALETAIAFKRIDFTADNSFALQWIAATTTNLPLFTSVLSYTPSTRARDRAFHLAAKYGRLPLMVLLFSPAGGVHPGSFENYAIRAASSAGHADVVRFLLSTGRVHAGACDNYAIIAASGGGHADVVRMLLETGEVDPSSNENEALRSASINGHYEVVRLLLFEEFGTDVGNDGDWVAAPPPPPIVEEVLENPFEPQSPSTSTSSSLPPIQQGTSNATATQQARPPSRFLIPRPGIDPSAFSNYAIKMSCFYGHTDVVSLLLSCPDVDPSVADNTCIRNASENGHTEIVRLLLQDVRVDPSALDNYALRAAILKGFGDVVALLMDHWRIDLKRIGSAIVQEALDARQSDVLRLILAKLDGSGDFVGFRAERAMRGGYVRLGGNSLDGGDSVGGQESIPPAYESEVGDPVSMGVGARRRFSGVSASTAAQSSFIGYVNDEEDSIGGCLGCCIPLKLSVRRRGREREAERVGAVHRSGVGSSSGSGEMVSAGGGGVAQVREDERGLMDVGRGGASDEASRGGVQTRREFGLTWRRGRSNGRASSTASP
ncbi:hypothetical protein HDU97_008325 [Phlyctochytrium planicorne]|nr:hypothetical protein HDU97_008325 [Phlyctochytrium planicorne]